MATLNTIVCATDKRNLGYGSCVVDLKNIIGLLEVPKGYIFSDAELAALQTTLQAMIFADDVASRAYLIGMFAGATDNSEDVVTETLGYGTPQVVRDGKYNWQFRLTDGGFCLSKALRSHNSGHGDFLILDAQGIILGTTGTRTDGTKGLMGVPFDVFYARPFAISDGSTATNYSIQVSFDPSYVNEYAAFVKADFNVRSLKNLQDINLVSVAAPAAGVFQIQAKTGCDSMNLFDLYSAELADEANWTLTNALTGAAIAITSVAANATLDAFTVTADSADPNYPANATDKVILGLAPVSVLNAAGIEGFEGRTLTLERG